MHPRTRSALALSTGLLVAAATLTTMPAARADTAATYAGPTPLHVPDTISAVLGTTTVAVPDQGPASPYPAVGTVSGVAGTVTDVDVRMITTHSNPADLDVMLVGPGGQHTTLMSDAGGSADLSSRSLVFDDEAATEVPAGSIGSNERFRPTDVDAGPADSFPAPAPSDLTSQPLGAFDGTDPNGTWKLFVSDDTVADKGLVSYWTAYITTTSRTQPFPSTITVSGSAGVVTDVDLELKKLSHTWASDLDLMLVGPDGRRAMVMSDTGGVTTAADITLDDEADAQVPAVDAITTGRYAPVDRPDTCELNGDAFPAPAPSSVGVGTALATFDGVSANGEWQLFVVDGCPLDEGDLAEGWALHITTTDPAPQAAGSTTPVPAPAPAGPAPDTSHPRVTTTTPTTGARSRASADVTARLSEKVRAGTVSGRSVFLVLSGGTRHLAATVSWLPGTRTVVIDPARALRHETGYRVVVTTAVKDLAGNRLDQRPARAGLQPKTWTFTTR